MESARGPDFVAPHIGDKDILPSSVSVNHFTAMRGQEMQIMRKTLSQGSNSNKMAFQKLPRHMRRRAMSHGMKRLPRRLREIHKNQIQKSGLPPRQKRPSRKYRRRPYNLTKEYLRRMRRIMWLGTHIWHAKRFHMVEKWGYKLPYTPCDRSFRACYRATAKHCLLSDISYYRCIEIVGDYNLIVEKFKSITNSKNGLTVGAKIYANGNREGSIVLYKYGSNLSKCIGDVYFMWKPDADSTKSLWIWIHAAYYKETVDTLVECFNLSLSMESDNVHQFYEYSNNEIQLKELCDLSRLRLTGPLSNAVLQNGLILYNNEENSQNEWVENYISDNKEKYNELFSNQKKIWNQLKSISSSSEFSPHKIVSLLIRDPRFNFPKKRTKGLPCSDGPPQLNFDNNVNVADSPLWSASVREIVKFNKVSNFEIAKMKEALLVPGTELPDKGAIFPVILIQRPGKKSAENLGYGSGWDIIVPSTWVQPMWLLLIMWGARVGGLKEANSLAFESGQIGYLSPDTEAGSQEESLISQDCIETFFKKPPNKRPNYNKFGISSPLNWNWKLLLKNWAKNESDVNELFVLRDKERLKDIQNLMQSKSEVSFETFENNCLVPVRLSLNKKGLCNKFAIICLPEEGDYKEEPTQPLIIDKLQLKRKLMRDKHKELLKRLRRRRIRAKKENKEIPIDKDLLLNYRNEMRKLWLPEPKSIRMSCSREVMGFIKHGDFSFLSAKSSAVGYIALNSLPALLRTKYKNKVLVRNNDNTQYRLATIEVILE